MTKFFSQDTIATGIAAGLGAEAGFALALTLGLLIAGESPAAHLRWYGGCFIPLVLVLRHYAKGKQHLKVVKALITVFFLTFVAFVFVLFKSRALQ